MPPKRFEGMGSIPPSHQSEQQLTNALYRLPESVSPEFVAEMTQKIAALVDTELELSEKHPLTTEAKTILHLKLARHYEDNGEAALINIPTMVDALVESPRWLQSDKGSVDKLFEIHEMKTLQRIAELRRKRAEQTDNGEFNPYENLFETNSGNYYLARLLNMPHLEEESEYMDHCVGTSDSYINKIKRGDVEIFSFRAKSTDEPIVTIEYDTKSGRLLQVKAKDDRIPTTADDFAPDLLEAIERLSETYNDKNEQRTVSGSEIPNLRQLVTLQEKQATDQALTREELVFLYEIDAPVIGFEPGTREPIINVLPLGRNIEADILTIFDCAEEEVAHDLASISENTKVYIGPLEPGIFQKLPENLEHVYTSFPEKPIRRETIEIGGKSAEQLISEMQDQGITISDYAKSMMDNPDFVVGEQREEIVLIRLTIAELGFKTNATTDQVYERAAALGLELCPADTGPQYCLAYKDQPLNDYVLIAMKPITDQDGFPGIFDLRRIDDGLWLDDYWTRPDNEWRPDDQFVFRLRKSEA